MNAETTANRCPKCHTPLPADAPQGLCPKCLLAAVATPTEAGQPAHAGSTPPALETVAAAFPQLEILECIGAGGMGVVYKARQPRLDRVVALKLLPLSLAADPAFAERFNREARLLARLNHPNIVTVHDFGQSGGFFFLLMEYVDGVNLRQAMEAGRFTPQQALLLVPKICEALQYAHDEGILHRDVKPSNILLDTRGRVKIADFGIAKLIGDRTGDLTLTASGAAIGTPHYMAPEQLEHPQDVDQRADIYSLGVVFYEMLTGELPIGRFAPPSQKAEVDSRVDEVVFHALEKEREKRFRSAGEVKTSVEAITANAPGGKTGPARTAVVPERRMNSYLTTPEHLRTYTGRVIYLYTAKGELRLDGEHLTFVSNWQSVVIPLVDIRELGIGHYSRLAKPVRLDYLAVTFDHAGQRRTLLFTPCPPGTVLPWEINQHVAECAAAVRQAVIARTGVAPAAPIALPNSLGADLAGVAKYLLPPMVVGALVVMLPMLLMPSRDSGLESTGQGAGAWMLFILGAVGSVMGAVALLTHRMLRRRQLDGSNADAPLDPASVVAQPSPSPDTSARQAPCYFSTPRRMRHCFPGPAAHIFLCKGALRLEEAKLTFLSPWQTSIAIPLQAIRRLSVGQFKMWHTPWVMKYARINFLAVTFTQDGRTLTVHLTPTTPLAASAADVNAAVAAWFETIQKAVVARVGNPPDVVDPPLLSVSAQPAWNRKGVPLFAAVMVCWVLAVLRLPRLSAPTPDPLTVAFFAAMLLTLILAAWFVVGFLQANSALKHGALDAVTSDDPPTPEPQDE